MFTIYGEKYYNDFTRQNVRMSFHSLNEIYDYMKSISYGFSDKYGNYFPTRRGDDYNWCGRISCSDKEDKLYRNFWIYKIENENGILYSNGRYTDGEKFCAKIVEDWLMDCRNKMENKKFSFVEE